MDHHWHLQGHSYDTHTPVFSSLPPYHTLLQSNHVSEEDLHSKTQNFISPHWSAVNLFKCNEPITCKNKQIDDNSDNA
jgi:hypothetical protein